MFGDVAERFLSDPVEGEPCPRVELDGIEIAQGSSSVVQQNFLGTDATGTIDRGNGGNGVRVVSALNTVGGAGVGNVVSGNGDCWRAPSRASRATSSGPTSPARRRSGTATTASAWTVTSSTSEAWADSAT